jgi:hypothetical protein
MGKLFVGLALSLVLFCALSAIAFAQTAEQNGWAIRRSLPVSLTGLQAVTVTTHQDVPVDRIIIYRANFYADNSVAGYNAVIWQNGVAKTIYFNLSSLNNPWATIVGSPGIYWVGVPIDPVPTGITSQRALYRELVRFTTPPAVSFPICPAQVAWGYFNLNGMLYCQLCQDYRATWSTQQPGTWRMYNTATLSNDTCTDGLPAYAIDGGTP